MARTIFKVHKANVDQFTTVLNDAIRDKRLTFRATGLLVYLLSLPDDWNTHQAHIAVQKQEGRDAVITAWRELEEFGYLKKELVRDKGVIVTTVWTIYERPDRITEKPETVQPETDEPKSANPEVRKKEDNERNIDEVEPLPLFGLPHSPPASPPVEKEKVVDLNKFPTSGNAQKISAIFRRRLDTQWSEKEIRSFRKLGPIDADELQIVARFYEVEGRKLKHYLRRDMLTFLNNYRGEVDRARVWAGRNPQLVQGDLFQDGEEESRAF